MTLSIRIIAALALLQAILCICPPRSEAVIVDLRADAGSIVMPNGASVPVWGFALGNGAVTVPGPQLVVPAGDTTLTINLTNNLPVPVSVVVPGQPLTPVPTQVGGRVMSFANEVAANSGPVPITFNGLKPGTFIYESSTNPAVQIPMGLYGAVIVRPAAAGQAYNDPASAFANEQIVIFSEIDPVLNNAVSTAPTTPYSTVGYAPRYFLINGKAFPETVDILAPIGQKTLLRLLNPGSRNYTPILQGSYQDAASGVFPLSLSTIAEDGNLLPFARMETGLILPAGKTLDAILDLTVAVTPGYYPFYDRRLSLMNDQVAMGGMMTFIRSDVAGKNCSPLKGDLNGDGKVDIADVLTTLRAFVGNTYNQAADVDLEPVTGLPCGDGTLALPDVLNVLRKALGMNPF